MGKFFKSDLVSASNPKEYTDVMALLNSFCNDVEEVTKGQVTCAMEAGFVTGFGQEWKIKAHSKAKSIDHILFRAYVPATGVPTKLDFYEEEMIECSDVQKVQQALESFAQQPTPVETLRTLSSGPTPARKRTRKPPQN